jgi:hypothetical protein
MWITIRKNGYKPKLPDALFQEEANAVSTSNSTRRTINKKK